MFVWTDKELNAAQSRAIRQPGSVFLVACPGSGKTRTLTYKIAQQLSALTSDKQRVVAITYTHRAADEIYERIEQLGVDTSQLWIGTIHSFCLEWILKPYAIYHDQLEFGFRIINAHDTEKMLQALCKTVVGHKINEFTCAHYLTSTGYVLTGASGNQRSVVEGVLKQYWASLQQNRQVDFELILFYAYQLIVSVPTISILLGSIFSAILVDEYQDTKEIQYFILASILKASRNKATAFIVGDPNQAIFASLGGNAIAAEKFGTMCGLKFKKMVLSANYRSSTRIVEFFGNFNVYPSVVQARGPSKSFPSLISLGRDIDRDELVTEIARLINYNVNVAGVSPSQICIVAPWWVHLASMTRKLVAVLPQYDFDGPGMVPFARDIDNFWYKLSRVILTEASPHLYVRRQRWAGEVLQGLADADADISKITRKTLLRACNRISLSETDGLLYLLTFFERLFGDLGIDFRANDMLMEHYDAFFESSRLRVERLQKEGSLAIGEVSMFRKVFAGRTGITVSTIHGVKGAEYDVVIAYGLLQGMVPHFNENSDDAANKLLYVIASRARKNLHLLTEKGRPRGGGWGDYQPTEVLMACSFGYDVVP